MTQTEENIIRRKPDVGYAVDSPLITGLSAMESSNTRHRSRSIRKIYSAYLIFLYTARRPTSLCICNVLYVSILTRVRWYIVRMSRYWQPVSTNQLISYNTDLWPIDFSHVV